MSTIHDVVSNFNTTPFLFIGSGMSRRYLNLPDWETLLRHFAKIARSNDDMAYSYYKQKAEKMECKVGLFPKIAELIQKDFDEKWFNDRSIRTSKQDLLKRIADEGLSPFKVEISEYIQNSSKIVTEMQNEIDKLSEISQNSIAGVITTNYDNFIENHFLKFKTYVGQNELIFSNLHGLGEIYKIHGSVEVPESIIINENDYIEFKNKSSYLAAKLMTIFMENPIIFMGYSMNDNNIRDIINSIVNCLDDEQLKVLKKRFIFIEFNENAKKADILSHSMSMPNGKILEMCKITLNDYLPLYNELGKKRAALPVSLLRRLKDELYTYTITNTPTSHLRVASIDDKRVNDEELVIAIGRAAELGLKGLSGIESEDLYRSIILDDLDFSADEIMEYAMPKIYKQNSGKVPFNKYLSMATKDFPECRKSAEFQTFDSIISRSIKKNRKYIGEYKSVSEIWNSESNKEKATRLISYLTEEQMSVIELENVLKEIFKENNKVLNKSNDDQRLKTNIRLLIRIYDYLKWHKKTKELPD